MEKTISEKLDFNARMTAYYNKEILLELSEENYILVAFIGKQLQELHFEREELLSKRE